MPKRTVIIDSNPTWHDYGCRNPLLCELLDSARKGEIKVGIPEVVVDEINRQYREHVASERTAVARALGSYDRLTGTRHECPISLGEVESLGAEFDFAPAFKAKGGSVLPFPDVDPRTLHRRSLEHRRPFDDDDRGYRDALIWETVLTELAQSTERVIFVTRDKGFYDGREPHPHLLEDLKARGITPDRLILVKTFEEALALTQFVLAVKVKEEVRTEDIATVAVTRKEDERELRLRIAGFGYSVGALPQEFHQRLEQALVGEPLSTEETGLPSRLWLGQRVERVESMSIEGPIGVERLHPRVLFISVPILATCEISYTPVFDGVPAGQKLSGSDTYDRYLQSTGFREYHRMHLWIEAYASLDADRGWIMEAGLFRICPAALFPPGPAPGFA